MPDGVAGRHVERGRWDLEAPDAAMHPGACGYGSAGASLPGMPSACGAASTGYAQRAGGGMPHHQAAGGGLSRMAAEVVANMAELSPYTQEPPYAHAEPYHQ
eukprot:5445511-Prymnesium_polylepis.1